MVRGMMRPEDDAIRPKVTIPLLKAWPEDPRIAKAVMLVPNSESRKTTGPSERLARKYSSAPWVPPRRNHREARVVEEADGQEAEDQRPRRPPEPDVLVERVHDGHEQGQEQAPC